MRKMSLILTVAALSFPLGVFAQSSAPTITSVESSVADRNTRLIIQGSNFTSYNTVKLEKDGQVLEGTATSATGTTALVNLRTPAGGTYQVTLTTSRGQASNAASVTIQAPEPTPSPTPAASSFPQINPFVFGFPTPGPTRSLRFHLAPPPSPIPTPILTCPVNFLFCRRPTHVYTALGDSLGTGLIAAGGYVHTYEQEVERARGIEIDLQNRSQIGATSEMLKVAVQFDPRVRQSVQRADFITFNVGGNDLRSARDRYRRRQCGGEDNQDCLRQTLNRFRDNWTAITTEIISLRKNEAVIIRSMDIYYPFVNQDKASGDFAVLQPYLQQVNDHIASTLNSHNIPFARVSAAFNGENGDIDPADRGLIGFDGFHPNTRGHRVIADLLLKLGV